MSKIYKGYELLKAIEEDEVKNGQKVKDLDGNIYIVVATVDLLNNENGNPILEEMNLDTLLLMGFELIEDEINIQEIEKIDYKGKTIASIKSEDECTGCGIVNIDIFKKIIENQDLLIQAVKQLDREIKEIKSLNIEINEEDINKAIKNARKQMREERKQ